MTALVKPAPSEIIKARAENPKMRERDLAAQLGISEAEFVAAFVGEGVTCIEPRVNDVLSGLEAVGEVMATCASSRRSGHMASRSKSATATGSGTACSSSTRPARRCTRCI